ncbi:MAG: phosphoglycerate dehydrogenase [Lactobacillaceae bacterium]|jgi:phosphoglycerate dehydrogenase-like enzyme|nr:phosphoglycerate dehydrogenase [Lactobacillaceae bacterium]
MLNILTLITIPAKDVANIKEKFPNAVDIFTKDDNPDLSLIDVLITSPDVHDDNLMKSLPNLKWVQTVSAGVNFLDLSYIQEKDIALSNGKGFFSNTIAQTVLSYILALFRGLPTSLNDMKNHFWDNAVQSKDSWQPGHIQLKSLNNQKVVIFGTGSIAQEIVKLLAPFNVDLIGVNRSGKTNDEFPKVYKLSELNEEVFDADIVISTLPETEETKNIYNLDFFELFTSRPVFINVGRGTAVVEKDLVTAVNENLLSGVGLDVFQSEPLAQDSPLWDMPNAILTPHNSGFSQQGAMASLVELLGINIASFIEYRTIAKNQVDPKAGY